jgi:hypothetical protein
MAAVHKTPEEQARHDARLEELIFNAYGQESDFPKMRHGLRQCLKALSAFVVGWNGIGPERKFQIAQAAYIVAISSVGLQANQLRLGRADEEKEAFKFGLGFGYRDPKTISLDNPGQKLLN